MDNHQDNGPAGRHAAPAAMHAPALRVWLYAAFIRGHLAAQAGHPDGANPYIDPSRRIAWATGHAGNAWTTERDLLAPGGRHSRHPAAAIRTAMTRLATTPDQYAAPTAPTSPAVAS
jgi:hypothetical protein